MRRPLALCLLVLALGIAGCGTSGKTTIRLSLSQAGRRLELRVEVAATPGARARGLMGRRSLAEGRGMLFLFPGAPQRRAFWMKDTLIPLDVAFIRDRRVIEVRRMVPCREEPCPITASAEAADWALELPSGSLATARIGPGARLAALDDLPSPS